MPHTFVYIRNSLIQLHGGLTLTQPLLLDLIKQGKRASELLESAPTQHLFIRKMMDQRPPRRHRTNCLYIYGPPGIGKTTMIAQVLEEVKSVHPELNYYCKKSLSKYWDGYDNAPI